MPLVRSAAAAMELLSHAGMSHDRPDFGIRSVDDRRPRGRGQRGGRRLASVLQPPAFSQGHRRARQPRCWSSRRSPGISRPCCAAPSKPLLPDHDVYLTDWVNARNVPLLHGRFDLDDFIDLVIRFIRLLGPRIHVMAVCQPSVPVLAAVSLMAAGGDPCQPASMMLMGGPIDPRVNPTAVNRFATAHSLDWFERTVITTVPRALSRRLPPRLSGLPAACRVHQHEFRPPRHGALDDVPTISSAAMATAPRRPAPSTTNTASVMDLPADFYLADHRAGVPAPRSAAGPLPGARRSWSSRRRSSAPR